MAEFKRLSDVEVVAEPTESANVLIEENGVIKKAPKTAVGGAGGGVSSWNDLTDKPFGEEENVLYSFTGTVGVDSTTDELKTTFQLNGSAASFIEDIREYTVVLNGVEYHQVLSNFDLVMGYYLGNLTIGEHPEQKWGLECTCLPFLFTNNYLCIDASYSGEINFEIKTEKIVVQLDEKFIPDSIARTNDIPTPFSGSWNNLTDRPFYEEYPIIFQETCTLTYQEDPVSYEYYYFCHTEGPSVGNGKEFIVTVNGVSKKSTSIQWSLPIIGGSYSNGTIKIFPTEAHEELGYPDITIDFMLQDVEGSSVVPLDAKYLPKASAVADATGETPTAAEFNALLTALRDAGYLAN
jgi:hypothetical protein